MKIVKDNVYRPKRATGGRPSPTGLYRIVALENGKVRYEILTNSGERTGGGTIFTADVAEFQRMIQGSEE